MYSFPLLQSLWIFSHPPHLGTLEKHEESTLENSCAFPLLSFPYPRSTTSVYPAPWTKLFQSRQQTYFASFFSWVSTRGQTCILLLITWLCILGLEASLKSHFIEEKPKIFHSLSLYSGPSLFWCQPDFLNFQLSSVKPQITCWFPYSYHLFLLLCLCLYPYILMCSSHSPLFQSQYHNHSLISHCHNPTSPYSQS